MKLQSSLLRRENHGDGLLVDVSDGTAGKEHDIGQRRWRLYRYVRRTLLEDNKQSLKHFF